MSIQPVPKKGVDAVQKRLVLAIERRQRSYLWTPADSITFIPRVLPMIYGDGRALFALSTINQRPAYWVIRVCSSWSTGLDYRCSEEGQDFGEMTDDILSELEYEFGNGRCGYSGNSLFNSKRERKEYCKCEDCSRSGVARWPMVDGDGGCNWSRMDWPKGFETVPNPLSSRGNLLSIDDPNIEIDK